MKIKAKKIKRLEYKVKDFKNKMVVKYLNSKGYECDNSIFSMRRINNMIKKEQKKVMIQVKDEKNLKEGSYYIWDGYLIVKLVDALTGKEV